jgi:hypothetical protein
VCSANDFCEAELGSVVELAEAKYSHWHLTKLQPERKRRIEEIARSYPEFWKQAFHTLLLDRELLKKATLKRISFWREATAGNMPRPFRDLLLKRIEMSVRARLAATQSTIRRGATPTRIEVSLLPNDRRFEQAASEILDIARSKLRVLGAEDAAAERSIAHGRASAQRAAPMAVAESEGATRPEKSEPTLEQLASIDPLLSDLREARQKKVRDYKDAWRRAGTKITYEDIVEKAKPTWSNRTPVNRYLRGTLPGPEVRAIEKVLEQRPPKIPPTKTTKTTK